ncbi:MAG: ABC transporter permease [Desulfurococcales archaeon]|nr:ABC transporter permease [Desulfurococcales archaeon]
MDGADNVGRLLRYVVVRALLIIPTILILYTLIFIILRVIPGNPILSALGTHYVPPEILEEKMHRLGLDKPLYVQYFDYLWRVLHGDFGESMVIEGRSITHDLAYRIPATIELTVWGFTVSVLLGILTGTIAAVKRGSRIDYAMRVYGIVAYTLFIPWLGSLLILLFSVYLGWLPSGGRLDPSIDLDRITGIYTLDSLITGNIYAFVNALKHLVLPSITLGIVLSGAYTRLVRSNLSDILQADFIRAYRSRGLPENKVLLYALRNAMIPIVTYMGLQLAILLGGAVLTETTYSWPGLGSYLFEKIQYRDYSAIQGTIVVFAFIVGVVSLIVDIIYALVDPRIRY